jgi:ferredoxin
MDGYFCERDGGFTTTMKLELNKTTCIGCALCGETAPDLFSMGDYTAFLTREEIPENNTSMIEAARNAAADCPSQSIQLLPSTTPLDQKSD